MSDPRVQIVTDYGDAIFKRAHEPIEPAGFKPNWHDRPTLFKTYPGAALISLPDGPAPAERSFAEVVGQSSPTTQAAYTMTRLAWLLRMTYGVLARRMRVNWNQDTANRMPYPTAGWSRGTANGGGLYPLEVYWVSGGSGPLQPGVYHYSTGHHAVERLAVGNFTEQVRSAVGHHPDAEQTAQFLLISVRFWKNAFKYGNFSYHVVTQDLGALLSSWDVLGAGLGLPTRRILWFDDEPLNRLLGLDTDEESVLAVVPLPWAEGTDTQKVAAGGATVPAASTGAPVGVTRTAFERSRAIRRFPDIERVHRAALLDGEPRPHPAVAADPAIENPATTNPGTDRVGFPLPPERTGRLSQPVSDLLARRSSSFGSLSATPPLEFDELATILSAGTRGARYRSDLTTDSGPAWSRLSVFANHVKGLMPGCYLYDTAAHRLETATPGVPDGLLSQFLYSSYFTRLNYNLEQVAAVIAISGRLNAMVSTYGARGYRILNAEAGGVAQTIYLTTTAMGLGCGATLGFDHVAMSAALGFDGADERTLLFMLVGRERPGRADLDYQLNWGDD